MTPKQLQAALDRAGLSQRGAARELGIGERHMRRYVAGDAKIPKHVAIAVRCICEHTHASDCAVHNEPAYPAGPCSCGVSRATDSAKPSQGSKK